jgi:sulfur carrier protein
MDVFVNNKRLELHSPSKIKDAIDALQIPSSNGMAVAVNNNVVPRSEWENYEIHHEDTITLIRATQGG